MLKILFVDGTEGFTPHRISSRASGGIVSSLAILPVLLAGFGHEVSVLSQYDDAVIIDGVRHLKHQAVGNDFDAVVFNRNCITRSLTKLFEKQKKILWLHDIVDHRYFEDDAYMACDQVVALSAYCQYSYADYYGIPQERFTIIPNGVDKSVFFPGDYEKRDPNLYITASAPIKGLYPLEYLLYQMKRNNEAFNLHMYADMSLHDQANSKLHQTQLMALQAAGAEVFKPVPQAELAEVMRKAWCLLMPNHYPEICSNVLLQAQACGLPVVATGIGSVREFILDGHTGLVTRTGPSDMYWWWMDFTRDALKLYKDRGLHRHISEMSPASPKSWQEIAKRWNDEVFHG